MGLSNEPAIATLSKEDRSYLFHFFQVAVMQSPFVNRSPMGAGIDSLLMKELESLTDFEKATDSPYISGVLQLINDWYPDLRIICRSVPVILLPSLYWNGYAFVLPSGRPAIGIDFAVTTLNRSLASLGWEMLKEIERGATANRKSTQAAGLVNLAMYFAFKHPIYLLHAYGQATKAMDPAHWLNNSCCLMTMFVLLHELAHIQLNHLGAVRTLSSGVETINVRITSSQSMEYEADAYAAAQVMHGWSKRSDRGFTIINLGILFRFFALLDSLTKSPHLSYPHPRWQDRWQAINQFWRSPEDSVLARNIESVFESLDEHIRSHRTVSSCSGEGCPICEHFDVTNECRLQAH